MKPEFGTIGTIEFLTKKIRALKEGLAPYFKSYGTDSLISLQLTVKEADKTVVLPLISELAAYIGLSNFINSAPTDVNEKDTWREKITNVTRAAIQDLEELVAHPELGRLFSWAINEKSTRDQLHERVMFHVNSGQYEIAMLECAYLLHKDKQQHLQEQKGN